MLITDMNTIGNNLLMARKKAGKTQAQIAESSELSLRTYADIERGTTCPRLENFLKICKALNITPNDILVREATDLSYDFTTLKQQIQNRSLAEQNVALKLINTYLESL